MSIRYHARWISKKLCDHVRRNGKLQDGMFLSSYKGLIVIEPKANPVGDGEIMSPATAHTELDPAWCTDSPARLKRARQLLGLDSWEVTLQ